MAAGPRRTLDFARGLTFFWDDPAWISKLALLTLFGLLVYCAIGLPLVMGYFFRLLQRSARGEEPVLPAWSDFGGLLLDGLRSLGFHLAHIAVLFGPVALFGFVLHVAGAALDPEELGRTFDQQAALALLVVCFYGFILLLVLVLVVYLPAARARFAATGSFAAGFDVVANLAFIRRNFLNYVLAYVLFVVANALSNLGYLLCCVGVIPATLWAAAVLAWAEGQVVRLDPAFR